MGEEELPGASEGELDDAETVVEGARVEDADTLADAAASQAAALDEANELDEEPTALDGSAIDEEETTLIASPPDSGDGGDKDTPETSEPAEGDDAPVSDGADEASPATDDAQLDEGSRDEDGHHEPPHSGDALAHGDDEAPYSDDEPYSDDYPSSRPRQPLNIRLWLKRILVAALALTVVAVVVMYVRSLRDPLVVLPKKSNAQLLVRNVQVVDVVAGSTSGAMDVIIEGDTIKSIAPHKAAAATPAGARVIDGTGHTLIPGLIDIHCHLANSAAPAWERKLPDPELNMERLLYSGVTRALDPGSAVPDIFELRADVNAGKTLGPYVYAAGPIFTAPGGHPIPLIKELLPSVFADSIVEGMVRQVSNQQEVTTAIDALAAHKPDFVKIAIDRIPLESPRLDPKVAAMVVASAKAKGIRAVAHIGTTQDAMDAANAGVAAWIHGVYKERIADADIAKLAAFKIPMAPTLIVFRSYAEAGRGHFYSTALERQVMSEELLDSRDTIPDDWEVSKAAALFVQRLVEQQKNALHNVKRLSEAGVVIMAGSDAQSNVVHGPALHREMQLLSDAGLSPIDVLRAATLHPARFLTNKQDPEFGVVSAGKRADLVLIKGDPLKDTKAISNIAEVIAAGVVLERYPLEP